MSIQEDAYLDGARKARQAIADGVPRWITTSDRRLGEMIDPTTGLPLASLTAPPELAEWQSSYAKGFNDTIAAGLKSGEVAVDFRPLLMSRPEMLRALVNDRLGTLSTDQRTVHGPNDEFILELRLPKSGSKPRLTWIHYRLASGEEWPQFGLYDGPLEVALARNGRVLVFSSSHLLLSRDVSTTQVLNSYAV